MRKLTLYQPGSFMIIGLSLALFTACNKTKFKSSSQPQANNDVTLFAQGIDSYQGGNQTFYRASKFDLKFNGAGQKDDSQIINKQLPVDLVFVIDSSKSLENEIDAVKNGAKSLVEKLAASKINIQIGAVGFIDSYQSVTDRTIPMTNDPTQFIASMNQRIHAAEQYNADSTEGSLHAISKGLELLTGSQARPDAIKLLLLITDVVGHNGRQIDYWAEQTVPDAEAPDCSIDPVAKKINEAITAGKLKASEFYFYYSVPDYTKITLTGSDLAQAQFRCPSNNLNIVEQMAALMNAINPDIALEKRGGALKDAQQNGVWPLNQSTLSDSLIHTIQQQAQLVQNRICYAESMTITAGTLAPLEWKAESVSQLTATPELTISSLFTGEKLNSEDTSVVTINRCCIDKSNQSPSLQKCDASYKQVVDYTLKLAN